MKFLLIIACLVGCSFAVFAQSSSINIDIPVARSVRINPELHTPSFIQLNNYGLKENEAIAWLNNLSKPSFWILDSVVVEASGIKRYKLRQFYQDIPVLHGVYTLHIKDGFVTTAHGEWYNVENLDTTPALSFHQADLMAVQQSQQNNASVKNCGLVVLQRDGRNHLCYKIDLRSTKPLLRKFVFVDAHNGETVIEENRICAADVPATALTMYNGLANITVDQTAPTSFRLREAGRGIQTLNMNNDVDYAAATDFTDSDLLWNSPLANIRTAYDVHYGAEVAYDYFLNQHNLLSFDGSGALIQCYANFNSGYANAFWDGDVLTFGGGNGTFAPLTALDIVVHEYTHAVTEHSANLVYAGESGALNEAFSDIFAITADHLTHPASADWYIGDQVGSGGIPFRNLESPTVLQDPDTYQGDNWDFLFEEVHNNSTVMSHWYYLLVNGGSGTTDFGAPYNVSGIGLDKAADIAYRTLTVYLTPSSGYADAQLYSLEAAIDLFGPCTNEALQVAEAWKAVGLPLPMDYMIVAAFTHNDSLFCNVPSNVTFTNLSVNASSYNWDFGDGNTSNATNPVHTYAIPGTYNVTLTANGTATCNSSDVFVVNQAVTVNSGGSLTPAACVPVATNPLPNYGIRRVRLYTLDHTSGYANEGYKDFTCLTGPQLQAGSTYSFKVNGVTGSPQRVNAWIDFNNDGTFTTNETVLSDSGEYVNHFVHFPATPVLNTPLRLRVLAKDTGAIANACDDPVHSQAEDYSVTFLQTNLPPVAAFTGEAPQAAIGQPFQMFDTSWNAPTSWQWLIPGAYPETSADRDPIFYFNEFGTYDVRLIATNAFGSDTLFMPGYISVAADYKLCGGYSHTNAPFGTLTHGAMPQTPFIDNTHCAFFISVPCADTLFLQFETVPAFLTVKDGVNGNGLPLANGLVYSTTGELFIEVPVSTFANPGFTASWYSVFTAPTFPNGAFTVNGAHNVNTPLLFNDTSGLAVTRQHWDFGDGTESRSACPVHRYAYAGTFLVIHKVWNCFGLFNITSQNVFINGAANLVLPDSIVVNLGCGDSTVVNLVFQNSGTATLTGTVLGKNTQTSRNVLSHDPGSFPNPASHYANMVNALNNESPSKIITTQFSTNPMVLRDSLAGKDLLWFPEAVNGDLSNNLSYQKLSGVIREYVENGGTVLACSHHNDLVQRLNELRLFHLFYGNDDAAPQVIDPNAALLDSVYAPYYYFSGFNYYSDAPQLQNVLITNANNAERTELGYTTTGLGNAIYFGCDFSATPAAGPDKILNNAVREANHFNCPDWLFIGSNVVSVASTAFDTVALTFKADEVAVGSHDYYLRFNTNDASASLDSVLVRLNVSGAAGMELSASCLDFGEVNASSTANEKITIANNGCDTLFVNASVPGLLGYNITSYPAFVLPGETDSVVVSFASSLIGSANGTLQLQTNAYDTTICLTATVVTPPQALFNPTSLSVTLSCGDSLSLPLSLTNTGSGTLSYYLLNRDISTRPRVLVFTDGVDMNAGGEYDNVKNAILQFAPNAVFTNVNSGYTTVLQDSLSEKDILLFPKKEATGISNYTALSGVVQTFVANGGTVIFCGTPSAYANRIFELGLFNGSYYNWGNTGTLTLNANTDPLLNNTSAPYNFDGDVHLMHFSNPDIVTLLTQGSASALAYRNIGLGKAVYIGSEFSTLSNTWSRVVANAVVQGDAVVNGWVTTDDDSGTVAGGGLHTFDMDFNAGQLAVGTYEQTLLVQTNNPTQPVDSILLTLTVNGQAVLEAADSCVFFNSGFVGLATYDTLYIRNKGCDTLDIVALNATPTVFSVITSPQAVMPYDSLAVIISFDAAAAGSYNGTFTVNTNVGSTTVCLQAQASLMPTLNINPDAASMSFNVCQDSLQVSFAVQNAGPGTLVYYAATKPLTENLRVLVYAYGASTNPSFGLNHVLQTIEAMTEVSVVDTTHTQSAAALDSMLAYYDVVVFPNQDEVGVALSAFAPVITSFVSDGGTAIVCGSDNNPNNVTELGLMNAQTNGFVNNVSMKSFALTSAVMTNMPTTFMETSYAHREKIFNDDAIALVEEQFGLLTDGKIAAYRKVGIGRAYYLGFDFANASAEANTLLANAVRYHTYAHLNGVQTVDTLASGAQQNVTFTCFNPQDNGSYHFILQSNDPYGPDTFTLTLNGVYAACSEFLLTNDCNQTVSFQATNINNATSWNWNFGDGQTSNLQNPQHTYASSGSYVVTLITSNAFGSDTSLQTVVINDTPLQIQTSGNGLVGTPMQFNVTNVTGADGFQWSFGDNGSSIADTAVHIYSVAAVYAVSVSVTDSNGCVLTAIDTIAILPTTVGALTPPHGFLVYPNPASDFLLIETKQLTAGSSAELFDVLGRRILTQPLTKNKTVFRLTNVASGCYTLRLNVSGKPTENAKIIVSNER